MNPRTTPFELLSCTWPFPVPQQGFEPGWRAPLTHLRPVPEWNRLYWSIDWAELFRGGPRFRGTMSHFGVVFRIRVNSNGKLLFASPGRCEIRMGELSIFDGECDPEQSIDAKAGDILDIAVAHGPVEWRWGGRIAIVANAGHDLMNVHLPRVQAALRQPDGPPLKVFTDARHPIRTVISIYSMILNGYSPSKVYLYGGYQWKPFARSLLAQFLPFATTIPLPNIREQILNAAPPRLADVARDRWYVMKSCVSLLCDPLDFCMMDDDLFVLKPLAGPQALSATHDFVFVPEVDNETLYRSIWGDVFGDVPLAQTSRINTALYWLHMRKDRKRSAELMLRGLDRLEGKWAWEQGFYAHLFAGDRVLALDPLSYWYPFFCGLPGGMLGYDYANNPCGFTMVHFGGDVEKPGDSDALQLMPQILGPHR